MNKELPDIQAGFIKGRRTRDQIANICWIIEKAREFQKNIYFCFTEYTSLNTHLIVLITTNWKILQARLQQYLNQELPDVQDDLEKPEKPEIKLQTSIVS